MGRAQTENGLDFPTFGAFCPIPSLREWERNAESFFGSGNVDGVTGLLSSANHVIEAIDTAATIAADQPGCSRNEKQPAGTCKRNTDLQTIKIDSANIAAPSDQAAACLIKVPKR
jgi:hypothetical protein